MPVNNDFATEAKRFLASAGYVEPNLVVDYRYSRPGPGDRFTHEIADLVAFSGMPHTIRTACVSVVDTVASAVESKLDTLRYLGAPVALVGGGETVSLYALGTAAPAEVEKSDRRDWQARFNTRLSDLSPESVSAAKAGARQGSFINALLGEWAEQITEQALIRLLNTLFRDSLETLPKGVRKNHQAEKAILRLVCHLFACRVLEDKRIVQESATAKNALALAYERYPNNIDLSVTESEYVGNQLANRIYETLKRDFAFDSLNTEMLGHAYENAMVTPRLRKDLGIYYTPRLITEYILNSLPLESIPEDDRHLCDPCCGSGSFLLAGFERLNNLLSDLLASPAKRHSYLQARLTGKDIDEFACEIARLSLILTDPHNRDGWRVEPKDVLELTAQDFKKKPSIIVTNPKFKEIKKAGVRREFAADVLERLIDILAPGGLMGIVLPQSVLDSGAGASARKKVLQKCEVLEISLFPGGIFYSAAETVILLLRKKRSAYESSSLMVTTRELRSIDLPNFRNRRSFTRTYPVDYSKWQDDAEARFIVSPLADMLDNLVARCKQLKTVATVCPGIQLKPADATSVANVKDGVHDKPFVDRLDVLRPFALLTSEGIRTMRWLHYGPHLHRQREETVFNSEKVLISANRNPGSSWRLVAAIDRAKLYFSLNFHGIVPATRSVSLEEIAAVLNSPVANAWFDANCRKRWVVQDTLAKLPFPQFDATATKSIRELVRQMERAIISAWKRQEEGLFYQGIVGNADAYQILREIDRAVYDAYGLTPTERMKIDNVMNAEKRPG